MVRSNATPLTMTPPALTHLLLVVSTLISIVSYTSGMAWTGMDISAYEYQRKFHKTLSLGECPYRQVASDGEEGTQHIQEERCTLHKKGVVSNLERHINDTRNEKIDSPKGVMLYLGLCGGEGASYLGILHKGDCVAVDIASRLTFNDKIMVRAFIGFYKSSVDILNTEKEEIRDGMEPYYKDKYYVKNIFYGTLEMIFVQFKFWNTTQAEAAKKVVPSDHTMSICMREIHQRVGEPRSVTIINFSTARQDNYKVVTEKEWNRALRYVQILELQIQNTRDLIRKNEKDFHLKYELFPFTEPITKGAGRLTKPPNPPNPLAWESTSMLEVKLRQALHVVKKLSKKCGKYKKKVCRRARTLRRELKTKQAEIHKGRSSWMNFSKEEKLTFEKRHVSYIEASTNLADRLAKQVRRMLRKEKHKRLARKRNRNSLNQIPPSISGNRHPVRHPWRKLKKRKMKNQRKAKGGKQGWFF